MGRYDENKRRRAGQKSRDQNSEVMDIGELPPIKNKRRRNKCRKSFRKFCETYFPNRFNIKWSKDHLKIIELIEQAVLKGRLFALAMPRGSGKTTLCECAVIWAILYGHHRYAVLVAANEKHAKKRLQSIRREFECNPLLLEDFPEVIFPIRKLDRITQRSRAQTYQGEPTQMEFTATRIVLATMPDSEASSGIIECGGILGAIRGANFTRPDGFIDRPTFAMIDDPQTRASAKSVNQCNEREDLLAGDLLYLPGPGKKVAAVMPCTVIYPDDMAERLLDREKHPEWQGLRTKMVYQMPKNMGLWDDYADMLREELRIGNDGAKATDFYRKNRKKMDAGAKIAWPERHNEDELSAIQSAMNLYCRDVTSFLAECQNEPRAASDGTDVEQLSVDDIMRKQSGFERGVIPADADFVTTGTDVQGNVLYWMAIAWKRDFTGWVIDYGTYPPQRAKYYTLNTIRNTFDRVQALSHMSATVQTRAAINMHLSQLGGRQFERFDGDVMRQRAGLVDAGYEADAVFPACHESDHVFAPAFGRGIKASNRPMNEWQDYKKYGGPDLSLPWIHPPRSPKRETRHILFCANSAKTFLQKLLATDKGAAGCLQLFKTPTLTEHQMLAEHWTAEHGTKTEGQGRQLIEWKLKPTRENHLLDVAVHCVIAASIEGARLNANSPTALNPSAKKTKTKARRRRVSKLNC